MSPTYAGQVVIITGASSGIGWELARGFVARGAKVGLLARRLDKLNALALEIQDRGGVAAAARADVGDRGQTLQAIQQLSGTLGPVDLLVANAGVGMPTLLNPMNVGDIEQMFRVNVLGMVYAFEAVLPQMLERRRGHLAGVSSMAAFKGLPGESAYCASKAAMSAYLEGLRIHLRDRGVAVSTICPGFVKTPMTAINQFDMPWVLEADDAAQRIIRALARRRKVFKFPWQLAVLMKLTQWFPDWMVARVMSSYNENPPMPAGTGGGP